MLYPKDKHPYIKQVARILGYAIKDTLQRIRWQLTPGKDCHGGCLSCGFFDVCRKTPPKKEGRKDGTQRHRPQH